MKGEDESDKGGCSVAAMSPYTASYPAETDSPPLFLFQCDVLILIDDITRCALVVASFHTTDTVT